MTKVEHFDADGASSERLTSAKNSPLLIVALLVSCLTLISTVVASSFSHWLTVMLGPIGVRIGIFYACDDINGCDPDTEPETWQKTAAGLQAVSMVFGLCCVVAMILQLAMKKPPLGDKLRLVIVATCWATAGFMIAAAIVHYSNRENVPGVPLKMDLGWALILSTTNGCLFGATGILLIVYLLMSSN